MWISDQWQDFELIDCSGGEKLERWGSYTVVRPDPQAIWQTPRNRSEWNRQGGHYKRSSTGGGKWDRGNLPSDWTIGYKDLTFQVKPMNFKHMGLFPEQATNWDWAMEQIRNADREISVLNLFAYTGAATVACLKAGASVCHVDAAPGPNKTRRSPVSSTGRCAGSWTTVPSLWNGRSAAVIITTPSSWIRLPTAAGREEKCGNWKTICGISCA